MCTRSLELTFAPLLSLSRVTGASAGMSLCILPGQDFSKLPSGALISTTVSQTTAGVQQQRPPNLRDSRTPDAGQSYVGQGWERVGFSTLQIIQSVNTTTEGCRPNSSLKFFLTLRVSTHGLCDTPLNGSRGRCLGRSVPGEQTAAAHPFSVLGGVRRTSHRASLLLVSYTPR